MLSIPVSNKHYEKSACSCVSGLLSPCVGTIRDILAPQGSKTQNLALNSCYF